MSRNFGEAWSFKNRALPQADKRHNWDDCRWLETTGVGDSEQTTCIGLVALLDQEASYHHGRTEQGLWSMARLEVWAAGAR